MCRGWSGGVEQGARIGKEVVPWILSIYAGLEGMPDKGYLGLLQRKGISSGDLRNDKLIVWRYDSRVV